MQTIQTGDGKRLVKIPYGNDGSGGMGETGWAEDLGDGRYRIDNIPMRDGLNFGDIVRRNRNGVAVVKRGFEYKVALHYDKADDFREVQKRIDESGFRGTRIAMEGWTAPEGAEHGTAIMAISESMAEEEIEGLLEGTSFRLSSAYDEEDEDNDE